MKYFLSNYCYIHQNILYNRVIHFCYIFSNTYLNIEKHILLMNEVLFDFRMFLRRIRVYSNIYHQNIVHVLYLIIYILEQSFLQSLFEQSSPPYPRSQRHCPVLVHFPLPEHSFLQSFLSQIVPEKPV